MKIDQIPDIYIEQYLLNELPENLRKEMNELIMAENSLRDRIENLKESNKSILSGYPAEFMISEIEKRAKSIKSAAESAAEPENHQAENSANQARSVIINFSIKNLYKKISGASSRRYTLSLASAAVIILVVFFMVPGLRITDRFNTEYETDVRIKGLESKLVIYRMKGKEIEELKNFDIARKGDIIQLGYIATDKYRYGTIISIDGRGTVTLHHPESTENQNELTINKKIILNKSYELDDSPSFERFIMILSTEPVHTSDIISKAKKLAISRESSLNGPIDAGKETIEFSSVIKKIE